MGMFGNDTGSTGSGYVPPQRPDQLSRTYDLPPEQQDLNAPLDFQQNGFDVANQIQGMLQKDPSQDPMNQSALQQLYKQRLQDAVRPQGKFDRGMEMSNKIMANFIGPAMAAVSGPGYNQGFTDSVKGLKSQLRQSQLDRQNQMNDSIEQLKNIDALSTGGNANTLNALGKGFDYVNKQREAQQQLVQNSIAQQRLSLEQKKEDDSNDPTNPANVRAKAYADWMTGRNQTSKDNTTARVGGQEQVATTNANSREKVATIGADSRVKVGAGHDTTKVQTSDATIAGANQRSTDRNISHENIQKGKNEAGGERASHAAMVQLANSYMINTGKIPSWLDAQLQESHSPQGAPQPQAPAQSGGQQYDDAYFHSEIKRIKDLPQAEREKEKQRLIQLRKQQLANVT